MASTPKPTPGARTRYPEESLITTTGKGWDAWIALLDGLGARSMTHTQIAALLSGGGHIADGWWCQAITIGYEQHIGRRVVGQDCYGQFTASASRTVATTLDGALDGWQSVAGDRTDFNGVATTAPARVSSSEKFRYWRVNLADGSNVTVTISRKGDKAIVAIDHRNVGSTEAGAAWKAYWKALLGEMTL